MNDILGICRRNIERAPRDAVERLSKFGVATVHEAMGRVGLARPVLHPIWPGAYACGTAVTVLLQPGDNWMMHVAAEQLQPGDVVVAACTAENTDGFFGDLLATSFRARGGHLLWHAKRLTDQRNPRCRYLLHDKWNNSHGSIGQVLRPHCRCDVGND